MKILKWFGIVVIAIPVLLIAGIFIRNKTVGPEGWARDNTIRALKGMMKDPDSMVIRSSYILKKQKSPDQTEISICGVADGRNSFGGFTGGSRFVSVSDDDSKFNTFDTLYVKLEDKSASEIGSIHKMKLLTPFEAAYWNSHCVDSLHPAITPDI
jgi:hypothetical protein